MLLVVAARPVRPAMRLVVVMLAAIGGKFPISSEPDDGAAWPDQMRRKIGGRGQRSPCLHQAIARGCQPRRIGFAAEQCLALRDEARDGDGATAEARDGCLVFILLPPAPVPEIKEVGPRQFVD